MHVNNQFRHSKVRTKISYIRFSFNYYKTNISLMNIQRSVNGCLSVDAHMGWLFLRPSIEVPIDVDAPALRVPSFAPLTFRLFCCETDLSSP